MWTSIVVNVSFFLWISWSLAARKWRVTARHLVFVYREWVNVFHRPKGPLSKGNSAWSAQLPGSTELSCFLSFIIWWSGSHRCSWGPGSLTDFLLFQNTEMVTWVKASTSLLRFWDLRYPFITKIPSHPSVSDLDAPSFGPWYIATHLTAPQFCCEGSATDQTLTFALFLSLQQCFIYGYVAK